MKFLKILLIIVLLLVPVISYSTGTITSGDNIVQFKLGQPSTLNEWFYGLNLREKIDVYTCWQGRVYSQKLDK